MELREHSRVRLQIKTGVKGEKPFETVEIVAIGADRYGFFRTWGKYNDHLTERHVSQIVEVLPE